MTRTTEGREGRPAPSCNRLTIAFPRRILDAIRRTETLLETDTSTVMRSAADLYTTISDAVADGAKVEVVLWEPGQNQPSFITPTEFRSAQRYVENQRREITTMKTPQIPQ